MKKQVPGGWRVAQSGVPKSSRLADGCSNRPLTGNRGVALIQTVAVI